MNLADVARQQSRAQMFGGLLQNPSLRIGEPGPSLADHQEEQRLNLSGLGHGDPAQGPSTTSAPANGASVARDLAGNLARDNVGGMVSGAVARGLMSGDFSPQAPSPLGVGVGLARGLLGMAQDVDGTREANSRPVNLGLGALSMALSALNPGVGLLTSLVGPPAYRAFFGDLTSQGIGRATFGPQFGQGISEEDAARQAAVYNGLLGDFRDAESRAVDSTARQRQTAILRDLVAHFRAQEAAAQDAADAAHAARMSGMEGGGWAVRNGVLGWGGGGAAPGGATPGTDGHGGLAGHDGRSSMGGSRGFGGGSSGEGGGDGD